MLSSRLKFLLLFGLLALAVPLARCEDETDDEAVEAESDSLADEAAEDSDSEQKLKSSLEAETSLLFLKPVIPPDSAVELPAGKLVEIIVGFQNKANYDFVIDTLDASFRFPLDFGYHLQNFTPVAYDYTVKPGQLASIHYAFIPAEAFGSRSYGLNVRLVYHDLNGNYFSDAVFNQTIPIVELDEGMDTEIFFLYIFLAALVVLLCVLSSQFFLWGKRKTIGSSRSSKPKSAVETGTKKKDDDIDFDWIPKDALINTKGKKSNRNTPKTSPKTPTKSPGARKAKKAAAKRDD